MKLLRRVAPLLAAALALSACTSTPPRRAEEPPRTSAPAPRSPSTAQAPAPAPPVGMPSPRRGAYYQDDGPGDNPPPDLELTPDAVPADEPPLKTAANRPYVVFGRTYTPQVNGDGYRQRGMGSWYGRKFHGQKTSSGEPYDMYAMTAAHPTLPLPSWVRVTNVVNGKSVVVKVNDRGPFHSDRIIDLSYTAAYKLGYAAQGSSMLEITRVRPGDVPPVMVAAAGAPAAQPVPQASSRTQAAPRTGVGDAPGATRQPTEGESVARVGTVGAAAQPEPARTESARTEPATGVAAGSTAPAASAVSSPPAAGTPAAVALATSTQPDGVYLQLGAFGAREGAEEFRIKTYQQLPWLTETMYIVARDRLHRVQLGPYRDRAAAQSVADRIREALQFKPVFVLR